MILRTGKVVQGEIKLFGWHHSQICLHAPLHTNTRFGLSMSCNLCNSLHPNKPFHDRCRVGRSHNKVQISHRFHSSAKTPSGFCTLHIRESLQIRQNTFDHRPSIPPQMTSGISLPVLYTRQYLFLSLGTKTLKFSDFSLLACLSQRVD